MKSVTVSVFILTYNQERYIAQTLESILTQKTDFKFQLVIGEDHSTDKTRSIIESYRDKNPTMIKLLPALSQNIGLIENYMRTIKECDGKYIAICDGDDYWIDENKLQKQVDFLEHNTEFSIVFTNIKKELSNGHFKTRNTPKKEVSDFNDLIFNNYIASVSVLFRNNKDINQLPNWILKYPYGDWPTYLWTIKDSGKIKFLNDVTAVHRIETGITSSLKNDLSTLLKTNLNILKDVYQDEQFSNRRSITKQAMHVMREKLMTVYNREKYYFKGLIQFTRNLTYIKKCLTTTKLYLYSLTKSV